jgi:hypothetical protein
VTSKVRAFDAALGDEDTDKLKDPAGNPLPYVRDREELAILVPRVLYGELKPWSLRRFQLHLSIGQAF